MKSKSIGRILKISIKVILVIILLTWMFIGFSKGSKECNTDQDCFVYGETGDCNCGCYSKKPLTIFKTKCFCAAPEACGCIDNQCQAVPQE